MYFFSTCLCALVRVRFQAYTAPFGSHQSRETSLSHVTSLSCYTYSTTYISATSASVERNIFSDRRDKNLKDVSSFMSKVMIMKTQNFIIYEPNKN